MGRWAGVLWVVGALVLTGCFAAPVYQGPKSDHFDGETFRNRVPTKTKGFEDFLRWRRTRVAGSWPEWIDAEPGPAPPERVADGRLRLTFVNHSTLSAQMDGPNILTDPIWSDRTSPLSWAGPERVRPPGIRFEDLPPIDAVIISHNHYDHLDIPTLQEIERVHGAPVYAGLGNAAFLDSEGISSPVDMDWWDTIELGKGVELTAVPCQHFSGRGISDRNKTLWMGFVIKGPSGAVYFAGDTGYGPHFEEIAERFAPLRLSILPIGAYKPADFMSPIHVSPAESVQAHQVLGAPVSVGMHFGTFPLADDGFEDPIKDLKRALNEQSVPEESFWVLDFGEGREVPPLETASNQ